MFEKEKNENKLSVGLLVLLLIFLVAFISCTDNIIPRNSDFHLKLFLVRKEKSRDSNSQITKINIANGIAEYSVTHKGRDPRPTKIKKYKLNKKKEEQLIQYIIQHKLNRNIQEEKPEARPGINISLLLEIRIGKVVTKVRIIGATNIWGRTKNGKKSIIKNLVYCDNVHSLLVFMKRKLGFDMIEL